MADLMAGLTIGTPTPRLDHDEFHLEPCLKGSGGAFYLVGLSLNVSKL